MNYQHKYSKYKFKYLNLLRQNNRTKTQINNNQVIEADLELLNNNNLLEKTTKKFIDSLKDSTPIYKLDPTEARNVLNQIQSDESYKFFVDIENLDINIDSQNVSMTIFRPKDNKNVLNAIIYIHGAGWILGNNQTHGRLVSEIAVGADVAVVFVNYTLAPETKYPTQIEQCYSAIKYICYNGKKHNIDSTKLILAGDSVGGNMVAALTLILANNPTDISQHIGYQILLYPVTDASMSSASYDTYAGGPWLTKKAMQWFYDAYLNDNEDRSHITISPLNASAAQLKNLPPGLIITDENDVLRSEDEAYAHKLINAGINVTVVRYLGTTHDFLMLDPLKDTPATISAMNLVIDHIKKFFNNNL
jgi:acetyl esterase